MNSRTTTKEDLVTILLSLWMVVGLLVDAFKHSTDPTLETFWTPSHALFYSGFLATAGWLVFVTFRRRRPSQSWSESIPLAHRTALIGVGVFAAGGFSDATWHEVLGVETGLDALLSPTHVLLFVGMTLIVSTPFRAAWLDRSANRSPSLRNFLPALASATFTTALVAFFFEYTWVLAMRDIAVQRYVPDSDVGELLAVLGILGIVVTTFILMPPVLLMSRRWRPPFGSVTLLFVGVNVFVALAFDLDMSGILPSLVAGVVADTLLAGDLDRRVTSFAIPFVLFATYFAVVGQDSRGLGWPPEIWGGAIFFAGLASLGMELSLEAVGRLDRGSVPDRREPSTPRRSTSE